MSRAVAFFLITIACVVLLFMTFSPGVSVIEVTTLERRAVPEEQERALTPVEVAVYYEALCPYSRRFISTRLLPAYLAAPRLMNLSLVPYGNAKTKLTAEGYEFRCQHGPRECQGNKIHSCAVELVGDPRSRLEFVACTVDDQGDPVNSAPECAGRLGIAWEPIEDCSEGTMGSELLRANGVRTRAVRPRIRGVPTTTLNGIPQTGRARWKDLLGEVCKLFADPKPDECLQGS